MVFVVKFALDHSYVIDESLWYIALLYPNSFAVEP